MLDAGLAREQDSGELVEFFHTGTAVKGEFHCAECGYGVTVYTRLPACPMCAGRDWEQATWSPFSRQSPPLL